MEAKGVRSVDDAKQIVEQRELSHVKVGVFDIEACCVVST